MEQSYLQSRNRDTDIENKNRDTKWGREVRVTGGMGWTYIHYWYCV